MEIINSFPGYEYVDGKNMYRGVDLGKGGYVYAEPGIYKNIALLDVASMHPHSIIAMNCFGEYTQRFKELLDARMAIKHGDFDTARKMLNGALAPYLNDPSVAKDLAQALKIAINSVYGLTSAKFSNPFKDPRNNNNIVALRGALFMKTLQDEVQARGYTVVHIKTDSIKIADADEDIIKFVMDFAKPYGYTFEHEATYDRICLVNDAVYIAKYANGGEWTATGAQFQVPYVFKKLFSKEHIEFKDLCETKEVKTALYLDMNEELPDVTAFEKELASLEKAKAERVDGRRETLMKKIEEGHDYRFVGKIGNFCPIKPGHGGGELLRESGENKYASATGAKGYRWLESEVVKNLEMEDAIDYSYFNNLVDKAIEAINKYGDFEQFVG